jgi:hypothetical protein
MVVILDKALVVRPEAINILDLNLKWLVVEESLDLNKIL